MTNGRGRGKGERRKGGTRELHGEFRVKGEREKGKSHGEFRAKGERGKGESRNSSLEVQGRRARRKALNQHNERHR
jgi:hypothetical protein